MSDDIPIVVSDKISASIEKKLKAIGVAARGAATDVDFLKRAIAGVASSVSAFQRVTTAANTMRTAVRGAGTQFKTTATQATGLGAGLGAVNQQARAATSGLQRTAAAATTLRMAARQSSAQLAAMSAQSGYLGARLGIVNQQARVAAGGIAHFNAGHTQMTRQIVTGNGALRQAATYLATFAGIRAFVTAADGAANMRNQIRLVTKSEEELIATQQRLFDIALKTNTNIDATSRLYTRLVQALGGTATATRQAFMMTELLNMAVIATGRTSSEASSAILQFTQAMAKGKLDGDEFRSLLENLPILGKALEKQLHVTRGELLELAPAGKITMDVISKAVLAMKTDVYKAFADVEKTIGMALENLNTRFVMFMNENGAAAQVLIKAIDWLGMNLGPVIGLVIAFGAAWGTVLVGNVIHDFIMLSGLLLTFATVTLPTTIGALYAWAIAQGGVAAALATTAGAIYAIVGPIVVFTAVVIAMTYAFATFLDLITFGTVGYTEKVNKLFLDLGALVNQLVTNIVGVGTAAASEMQVVGQEGSMAITDAAMASGTLTEELGRVETQADATGSALSSMADKTVAGISRINNQIEMLIWKMRGGVEQATKLFNALQAVGGSQGSFQTAGITNTGANSSITNVPRPQGFAGGGSFIQKGKPGVDKNLANFRVSRGERVDISTRRQQRQDRRNVQNNDNRTINFNVYTSDAESFRRSRGQIAGDFAAIVGNGQ